MNRSVVLLTLVLTACSATLSPDDEQTLEALPELTPVPADAPLDEARVQLGRSLFWDPILSGDRDVACASCHHPDFGYADGRAVSLGTGAVGLGPDRRAAAPHAAPVTRNAPTVLDVAFNGWTRGDQPIAPELAPMFWDARVTSLETQVLGPLRSEAEMRGPHLAEDRVLPELVARLETIPTYRVMFTEAFGDDAIDAGRIASAIATYERTLVARDSSFDRFMNGDDRALDLSQRRGLIAFFDAGCAACHAGPMLSDYELHDLGVGDADQIRTPSLRNVTRTAPYMHDGSRATLEDVIALYRDVDRGRDPALATLQPVSGRQADDLLRFLDALSDGTIVDEVPASVPSGLAVGGALEQDDP